MKILPVALAVFALASCAEESGPPLQPRSDTQQCQPMQGDMPAMRLSETGCFDDVAALLPAADLIPYSTVAPLWSDGTGKDRYFSLPPGATLGIEGDDFVVPDGTVFIKLFELAAQGGIVRLEARFLVHQEGDVRLFSYRFDEDGADATLVDEDETLELIAADGVPVSYLWPDVSTCTICHGTSKRLLGFIPAQLDYRYDYGPSTENQLVALRDIGALVGERGDAPVLNLVNPYGGGDPAPRARSWLHTNCSHCHRPGGWAPSSIGMDFRASTPLLESGICDPVGFGTFTAYRRFEPGFPDYSAIVLRVEAEGIDRMPPVGVSRHDVRGAGVLREWAAATTVCE